MELFFIFCLFPGLFFNPTQVKAGVKNSLFPVFSVPTCASEGVFVTNYRIKVHSLSFLPQVTIIFLARRGTFPLLSYA